MKGRRPSRALIAVWGYAEHRLVASCLSDRPVEYQGGTDMFTKCLKIGITVSDMERSVAFYRDVLGFDEVKRGESFEEEDEGLGLRGNHLIVTALGSRECHIELMQFLSPRGEANAPKLNDVGCVHVALAVDDVERGVQKACGRGCKRQFGTTEG